MTNTLYVANLPSNTSEDSLRRHFAACGGVAYVEIAAERRGKSSSGLARVTMTSPAYATAALGRLDGVAFEGRVLRVSDSPIPATTAAKTVTIVQQFRERANMTYDLDCAGMPLTLRVFPVEGEQWRIEARSTEAEDAVVVTGAGATRRAALGIVLQDWNERAASSSMRRIDSDGLLRAMSDVRAI